MKIQEISDDANEVDAERSAIRDRRLRATRIAAGKQKQLQEIQKQINSLKDDAPDSRRISLLEQYQEVAAEYRAAAKVAEHCDARAEFLNEKANEIIQNAEKYIESSNQQLAAAHQAAASSNYGRDAIRELSRRLGSNRERAKQVILLLGGKIAGFETNSQNFSQDAVDYLQEYQELINEAAFGSIEGIEGQPSIPDRQAMVAFLNEAYSEEIVALAAGIPGVSEQDGIRAISALEEAYIQTGATGLWEEQVDERQPADNGLIQNEDLSKILAFQEYVERQCAETDKYRNAPVLKLGRTIDSGKPRKPAANNDELVAAWDETSCSYRKLLESPGITIEEKNQIVASYRHDRESFFSLFDIDEYDNPDIPKLTRIQETSKYFDAISHSDYENDSDLMHLDIQFFASGQDYDDNYIDFQRTANTRRELEIIAEEDREEFAQQGKVSEPEWKSPNLPTSHTGIFTGNPGDSSFIPNSTTAIKRMQEFGCDSVEYRHGYPVFEPFTEHDSPYGRIKCQVEIGHMTDQRENPSWEFGERPNNSSYDLNFDLGNFKQADRALAESIVSRSHSGTVNSVPCDEQFLNVCRNISKWRKAARLTWHECADGKTMQLVPTEIHSACRHSGGVSLMKLLMRYGDISLDT